MLEKLLGVHRDAPVPDYHSRSAHELLRRLPPPASAPVATPGTTGRVAIFSTC